MALTPIGTRPPAAATTAVGPAPLARAATGTGNGTAGAAASGTAGAAARRMPLVRTAVLALVLALALLTGLLAGAPAARAEAPRTITVEDTTGDLNAAALTERLQRIDFRESVDIVALTVDVRALGYSPSSNLALNDAVLAYATQNHPEWITDGGAFWRDGLVIIAIDPDNRFVGAYAGEDVKLSDGQFVDIQEAMRGPARQADWNGAIVEGAAEYASLLGRPFYLDPTVILSALAAVGLAVAAFFATLWRGSSVARRARRAIARYDDVMMQFVETELAAKTIPETSRYGEPVLRDYDEFSQRAAEATRLRQELPAHLGVMWGLKPGSADRARAFDAAVSRIDELDDQIIATNDLLNRGSRWREAWEREMAPIRDSLAQVDQAVMQERSLADAPTARALRTVADKVEAGLASTTRALEEQTMSPDDALAELDLMTAALGRAATAHRDAVIAATARSEQEAEVMRDAGQGYAERDRYGTIRGRRWSRYPASYDPFWNLSPILWLSTWQHSASTDLDTYRNPPQSSSSSGGFSGYSGGGGGFSGAGSSGRF